MTTVTSEIQWLTYILQDFKVPFEQPSLLYCYNDSTRYIATNTVFHEHTKHIEIDCHVVREKLKKSLIHLLPISTTEQLTDLYTKFKSSIFQKYLFQAESHQYLLPNSWGSKGYGNKSCRRMIILIV